MRIGNPNVSSMQGRKRLLLVCIALLLGLDFLCGCEMDSFMDPSILGRWERTPVVLPILDRLDVIDEPIHEIEGLSQVQPDDLVAHIHEYVIGPLDVIAITVFELMQPNTDSVLIRKVDELGMVRLPVIGPVNAGGMTPSGLEQHLIELLDIQGILKDAMVSIAVQEGRQNSFSVVGGPAAGAAVGTYVIPKNDFRLFEAMALAGGVSDQVKTIHVIRKLSLAQANQDFTSPDVVSGPENLAGRPSEAVDLIEDLLNSVDDDFQAPYPESENPSAIDQAPAALDRSMDAVLDQPSHWAFINGQWIRVEPKAGSQTTPTTMPSGTSSNAVTQRVIEVPYQELLNNDMRYNVVIRSGDMIRVSPPITGNVYIGGSISRPGTYALPGTDGLTVKQLVFAAGNLATSAIPQRVDLIRRLDNDQEATVRLDLKAIFDGSQPDFYLKPNDTLNIGTSFVSVPLAVLRNGFRLSYGFGFVLDRNFDFDVFGRDLNR